MFNNLFANITDRDIKKADKAMMPWAILVVVLILGSLSGGAEAGDFAGHYGERDFFLEWHGNAEEEEALLRVHLPGQRPFTMLVTEKHAPSVLEGYLEPVTAREIVEARLGASLDELKRIVSLDGHDVQVRALSMVGTTNVALEIREKGSEKVEEFVVVDTANPTIEQLEAFRDMGVDMAVVREQVFVTGPAMGLPVNVTRRLAGEVLS